MEYTSLKLTVYCAGHDTPLYSAKFVRVAYRLLLNLNLHTFATLQVQLFP